MKRLPDINAFKLMNHCYLAKKKLITYNLLTVDFLTFLALFFEELLNKAAALVGHDTCAKLRFWVKGRR